MKKNHTDLNILLDGSGSMGSLREDVIGGISTLIKEQREVDSSSCSLTLVQFDYSPYYELTMQYNEDRSGYQVIYDVCDIKSVDTEKLSNEYKPRGSTAYLDAIGKMIDDTGLRLTNTPEQDRPEKVVIVIFTDGMENASVKFSKREIAEKIKHQTDVYKWQFTFLGANFDAVSESQSLCIPKGSSLTYSATSTGVANSLRSVSANLLAYRGEERSSFEYTDEQRQSVIK